ncbi:glycosyltransferase family 2 protein [Pluralibacter gergoviae]|uniref:glycosyltransferase family 2 protein n=1 Tax=Pluralibacter gergoviae TaxID=61647 RepID=UPI002EDB2CE8
MNKAAPFFSIVIPAFNASKVISSTIESILKQDEHDFEIIIVDDNSDDCEELVTVIEAFRLKKHDIKLFLSKVKLNGSGARNKGVELSCGQYIALLDADDEWLPTKLSRIRQVISSCNDQNAIFYSKVHILSESDAKFSKIMPIKKFSKGKETMASYLFGCVGFIQTSSIVISRYAYDKISFNPKFIRHQDYDFCIRADYHDMKFIFIDEVLSKYKMSSVSANKKGETVAYSISWLLAMSKYLIKSDIHCFKAFKLSKKLNPLNGMRMFIFNYIFCTNKVKRDFLYSIYVKLLTKRKKSSF